MTENYLNVLEESLEKKLQVMARIRDYNQRQQEIFQSDKVELDKFDDYVDEKGVLIDELTALDNGFETLYEKVANELSGNREKYAVQIKRLQGLVSRVTEESVSIQAEEARNKQLIEQFFSRQRVGIKKSRVASKAAYDYYKNMINSNHVSSQYMDDKK